MNMVKDNVKHSVCTCENFYISICLVWLIIIILFIDKVFLFLSFGRNY